MLASTLAATSLLFVGCSATSASPKLSPTGFVMPDDIDISAYSDVQAVLDSSAETIVYPIDAFFVDRVTIDRFGKANDLLLQDCMLEGGRPYPPAEYDLSSASYTSDTFYGIWSMEKASRFGYELDPAPMRESDAANAAVLAAAQSDPGWDPALLECLDHTEHLPGIVRDTGGDGSAEIVELPQSIRNDALSLAMKNPAWDTTREAWSDCLVEHGLTLRSNEMQPWAPEVPDDPEAAIRTAVIDVQCKEDTKLVETLTSLESQYQAAMIDQQRAALDEVVKTEKTYVDRADEIIATHGG